MPGPGEEKPKVYYFNIKGKAYPTMMLLSCGHVDYEVVKFDMPEFVAKYKKDMPMGQVPVLEYKKQKMCQSRACSEFAADLAGMTPKDMWQKCKVTEMVGCCQDVVDKCMASCKEEAGMKKDTRSKLCKETLPSFFEGIDKIIGANNHPGFCVGEKMTAADVFVFCMVDQFKCGQFEHIPTNMCDSYGNITKVYDNMMKNTKVKECKTVADACPVMKF